MEFLLEEFPNLSLEEAGELITLTGDQDGIQAMSCIQYLTWRWPELNSFVLEHVLNVAKKYQKLGLDVCTEHASHISTRFTITLDRYKALVAAHGTADQICDVGE